MAQLKTELPQLIVTHCSAHRLAQHRLALAASDAAHANSWFKRFETTLNQVYTFFSHSTVCAAELEEVQRTMNHHPKLKTSEAF